MGNDTHLAVYHLLYSRPVYNTVFPILKLKIKIIKDFVLCSNTVLKLNWVLSSSLLFLKI